MDPPQHHGLTTVGHMAWFGKNVSYFPTDYVLASLDTMDNGKARSSEVFHIARASFDTNGMGYDGPNYMSFHKDDFVCPCAPPPGELPAAGWTYGWSFQQRIEYQLVHGWFPTNFVAGLPSFKPDLRTKLHAAASFERFRWARMVSII